MSAVRPDRVVQWVESSKPGPLRGILAIGFDSDDPPYAVCEVAGDAPRCFECQKVDGSEPYMVKLSAGGQPISCDCWGALRWQRCKHMAELGRLVSEGKL